MKNNESLLGSRQNAAQAAKYPNLYSGRDPQDYHECFEKVKLFIDQSLDEYKSELVRVLFPIFVCLFLNMILKKFTKEAHEFLNKHKSEFDPHYKHEVALLETVTD